MMGQLSNDKQFNANKGIYIVIISNLLENVNIPMRNIYISMQNDHFYDL